MLEQSNRILVVEAHPDDSIIAKGGLIQRLAGLGLDIQVMTITSGQKGKPEGPLITDEELGKIRTEENYRAFEHLGVPRSSVEPLNYMDGEIGVAQEAAVFADIYERIKGKEPSLVLSFDEDGLTGHHDHILAANISMALARQLGHQMVMRVTTPEEHYLTPEMQEFTDETDFYWLMHNKRPNTYSQADLITSNPFGNGVIELTDAEIDTKLHALEGMESQYRGVFDAFAGREEILRRALGVEGYRLVRTDGTSDVQPVRKSTPQTPYQVFSSNI
jgi:LmbE family N-acetylglucosaminyl deacetylase